MIEGNMTDIIQSRFAAQATDADARPAFSDEEVHPNMHEFESSN
jgi:hypothetical protein